MEYIQTDLPFVAEYVEETYDWMDSSTVDQDDFEYQQNIALGTASVSRYF